MTRQERRFSIDTQSNISSLIYIPAQSPYAILLLPKNVSFVRKCKVAAQKRTSIFVFFFSLFLSSCPDIIYQRYYFGIVGHQKTFLLTLNLS